jgi:hypothetical protein
MCNLVQSSAVQGEKQGALYVPQHSPQPGHAAGLEPAPAGYVPANTRGARKKKGGCPRGAKATLKAACS